VGQLIFPPGQRIFLDSNILIYYAEDAKPYADLLAGTFQSIGNGHIIAVVSSLSLLETSVVPLRKGNRDGADRFRELLCHSPHVEYTPITDEVLMRAAEIRAAMELRTPDAIQVATAQVSACDAMLTNDRRLSVVDSPTVVLLNDYL